MLCMKTLRTFPFSSSSSSLVSSFYRRINSDSGILPLLPEPSTVSICGCPLNFGQPLSGVELGPQIIRQSGGLLEKLDADGWNVEDQGDLDFSSIAHLRGDPDGSRADAKYNKFVGGACQMLAEETARAAAQGKFALTLGGDHSLAIGSIAGMLKTYQDLGVIFVDAHADINTPTISESGNIHGMVFGFLMNLDNTHVVPGFEWLKDAVGNFPRERLAYVGLRDIDANEKQYIKDIGLKAFTMFDIDNYGIGPVMNEAIAHVSGRKRRPIHLSFDIDALDPRFAPSTGTRVMGGLTYREAYFTTEIIAHTKQLVSMDIVEVNPALTEDDGSFETAKIASGLVSSAMGNIIL